jgi:hypothetical protein
MPKGPVMKSAADVMGAVVMGWSTPDLSRPPRNALSGSALVWFFVRNKRGAKEGRDRFQLNGKMLSLTLVHLRRACRLTICMAKGDTKCISRLTLFLSSKIDADQMEITNYFPLHHYCLFQLSMHRRLQQD